MAKFAAIAAVGRSLEALLGASFQQEEPVPGAKTKVMLVRAVDFDSSAAASVIGSPALSILLYRVDLNESMRAAWSAVSIQDGRAPLPVDLHYLLTPWADSAEHEHLILAKTLECLWSTPMLSGALLDPMGGWAPGESVELVMEDIPTLTKLDSMLSGFRLSAACLVRMVRIERHGQPDSPTTPRAKGLKPGVKP